MVSSFQKLNTIQFLAALNENLFKMLIAFFLIFLTGEESASRVMANVGILFLIPFLLFSTIGGILADKFSKRQIVLITRALECGLLLLAVVAVAIGSRAGSYILLFLMSTVAAIFSPSKYGLIPELYPKDNLLIANSIIAGFTYTGIILGTGAASLLVYITNYHFYLALILAFSVALCGFLISVTLPPTKTKDPKKKVPVFIYKTLITSLIEMRRLPKLLPAVFAFSYFLFIGAFVQLNIVPFSIQILDLSLISGGYLFLLAAIGIAIGAFVTSQIPRRRSLLPLIPYAGLAISLFMILLAIFPCMIWLLLLGFFGGIFLVPAQTHIVETSPKEVRGTYLGTANFLSYVFAILASISLYLLNTVLDLSPGTSFIVIGVINAGVMCLLLGWIR